jgi:hypothetical protein
MSKIAPINDFEPRLIGIPGIFSISSFGNGVLWCLFVVVSQDMIRDLTAESSWGHATD